MPSRALQAQYETAAELRDTIREVRAAIRRGVLGCLPPHHQERGEKGVCTCIQ